ncbi:MAG TPA: alkaline phosphatase family protein [Thermoanaerobaculia bacterium]|nr:alkaline phosphatase family protein [Thermoanaerobaculia bacterium]
MTAIGSPTIEHVVVLMFENRSYDNVLGMLYNSSFPAPWNAPPPGQAGLNGLNGPGPYENVNPYTGKEIAAWGSASDPTNLPTDDPNEFFFEMSQQILGLFLPPLKDSPYPTSGTLLSAGPHGLMGGFVTNFHGSGEAVADVMHSYVPMLMPVTAWLANRFMVCDSWYGSAPTQTFTNRMFAACGAPAVGPDALDPDKTIAYADNTDFVATPNGVTPAAGTLYTLLDAAKPANGNGTNWKIYFHDYSISAMILNEVHQRLSDSGNANLANFSWIDYPQGSPNNPLANPTTTFIEDITNGTLPPFALIEPRYSNNYPGNTSPKTSIIAPGLLPNSNHPGQSNDPGFRSAPNPAIDVRNGELLLLEVYAALRLSDYWKNTLLIVTYDEHGGLYDHVPPPAATPPGTPNAASGFGFNWFGPRVPTIIVSPYAPRGSRLIAPEGSAPFDHSSIITTVRDCFSGMGGPLTPRDAAAPSIYPSLMTSAQNHPDDMPSL